MVFSNATEWDIWSANWCQRCIMDKDEDCPIVLELFLGNHPPQITKNGPGLSDIHCQSFVVDLGETPEDTTEEATSVSGQYEMEF